jgi:hypothetical protein
MICLKSNLIWYIAPKSIIHAILETSAAIFKTLQPLFVATINAEVLSTTLFF